MGARMTAKASRPAAGAVGPPGRWRGSSGLLAGAASQVADATSARYAANAALDAEHLARGAAGATPAGAVQPGAGVGVRRATPMRESAMP